MKRIALIFLLLAGVVAQAQTVTEKDLLGKWSFTKMEFDGCTIDMETGKATIAADVAEELRQGGQDPEAMRAKLEEQMTGSDNKMEFVFKPGNKVEIVENTESKTDTYALTARDGKQFITMAVLETKLEMQIEIVNGYIKLTRASRKPSIMYFKKV